MVQLQKDLDKLHASGISVAAISYDKPEVLKKFAEKWKVEFPLLSDEGSATIKAFDIHNKGGLPHPGTFLVTPEGVVKAKLFIEGHRERHTSDELLDAVKGLTANQE